MYKHSVASQIKRTVMIKEHQLHLFLSVQSLLSHVYTESVLYKEILMMCYGHKPEWLCSNRIYTGKTYTQRAHQAQGLAKRAIVLEHYQHKKHKGVLGVQGVHSFYIERVISLMETIVFNSIQVINYWFILHRALRPLYQQAQTSSPNIQGISDQDVTL